MELFTSIPFKIFFLNFGTDTLQGGDLDQLITSLRKSGKNLSEKLVLSYLIELTMAAEYMHRRRVLHRDLKSR